MAIKVRVSYEADALTFMVIIIVLIRLLIPLINQARIPIFGQRPEVPVIVAIGQIIGVWMSSTLRLIIHTPMVHIMSMAAAQSFPVPLVAASSRFRRRSEVLLFPLFV